MKRWMTRERGQALVMVTLSLVAMFGMMGLAVDLGWSFFVKRSAQSAADAAALAGARAALASAGAGAITCNGNLPCGPVACPVNPGSGDVEQIACQYAAKQGFVNTGSQTVTIDANVGTPFFNTATGPVKVHYWVTATATQTVPQLFSAVMGKPNATIASRATAAIVESVVTGSLILLNRQNDGAPIGQGGKMAYGLDIIVQANDNQGHNALDAASGIIMSSTCNGVSTSSTNCSQANKAIWAGQNVGGGTVSAPITAIRGSGGVFNQGSSAWTQPPTNGMQGPSFLDPMRGKGQPPPPTGLQNVPILNGVINGATSPILYPGNYYAVAPPKGCGGCAPVPTGAPLTIQGTVRFAACQGCAAGQGFGNYVFFGGITGNTATAQFDPGMYVLAGALAGNNVLDTSTNFNMIDATQGIAQNTDAGELFIATNASYPGLQVPAALQSLQSMLGYAPVNIVSGNNGTIVDLHGLNRQNALVAGTPLEQFAPSLLWQDQGNSYVKYKPDGNIDTSCGSLDSPCTNTLANSTSPQMNLQASPNIHLFGAMYQPRGAWLNLIGGGGYSGPMQIVTGAVSIQGNAQLNMVKTPQSITTFVASLIE